MGLLDAELRPLMPSASSRLGSGTWKCGALLITRKGWRWFRLLGYWDD